MLDLAVRHRLQLISIAFPRRRSRSLHWLFHLPRLRCLGALPPDGLMVCFAAFASRSSWRFHLPRLRCLGALPPDGLLGRLRFAVFLEMVVLVRCCELQGVMGCCR